MRFTIRDVFWLMVVASLVTVWWRDSQTLRNQSVERIKLETLKALVQKQQQEVLQLRESRHQQAVQSERYRMLAEAYLSTSTPSENP